MSQFGQPMRPANAPFVGINPTGIDPNNALAMLMQTRQGTLNRESQERIASQRNQTELQVGRERNEVAGQELAVNAELAQAEMQLAREKMLEDQKFRMADLEDRKSAREFERKFSLEMHALELRIALLHEQQAQAIREGNEPLVTQLQQDIQGLNLEAADIEAALQKVKLAETFVTGGLLGDAGEPGTMMTGLFDAGSNYTQGRVRELDTLLGGVAAAIQAMTTQEDAPEWDPSLSSEDKTKVVGAASSMGASAIASMASGEDFANAATQIGNMFKRKSPKKSGAEPEGEVEAGPPSGMGELANSLALYLAPGAKGTPEGVAAVVEGLLNNLGDPNQVEAAQQAVRSLEEMGVDPSRLHHVATLLDRLDDGVDVMLQGLVASRELELGEGFSNRESIAKAMEESTETVKHLARLGKTLKNLQVGEGRPLWSRAPVQVDFEEMFVEVMSAVSGAEDPEQFLKVLATPEVDNEQEQHVRDTVEKLFPPDLQKKVLKAIQKKAALIGSQADLARKGETRTRSELEALSKDVVRRRGEAESRTKGATTQVESEARAATQAEIEAMLTELGEAINSGGV